MDLTKIQARILDLEDTIDDQNKKIAKIRAERSKPGGTVSAFGCIGDVAAIDSEKIDAHTRRLSHLISNRNKFEILEDALLEDGAEPILVVTLRKKLVKISADMDAAKLTSDQADECIRPRNLNDQYTTLITNRLKRRADRQLLKEVQKELYPIYTAIRELAQDIELDDDDEVDELNAGVVEETNANRERLSKMRARRDELETIEDSLLHWFQEPILMIKLKEIVARLEQAIKASKDNDSEHKKACMRNRAAYKREINFRDDRRDRRHREQERVAKQTS